MAKEKKQKGKMDMEAIMEVYRKLAIPGPRHKTLANLEGSRTTKTSYASNRWIETRLCHQ